MRSSRHSGRLVLATVLLQLLTATPYGAEAPSYQPFVAPPTRTAKAAQMPEPPEAQGPSMTAVERGLKGGENAVAQAMVALAQVRVPVAMLKTEAANSADGQTLLNAVESDVDTAMNAYQNAVLASTDNAVLALSNEAQIAAISAQVWVNIAVAQLQLHRLRQHLSKAPSTLSQAAYQDRVLASTAQAMARAITHAEVTKQQKQAAMKAARQVESAFSEEESRAALTSLREMKVAITVRAMALGAQVILLSAQATGDPMAIDATRKAADAAEDLVNQLEHRSLKPDAQSVASHALNPVAREAQMAVVRVRMAMAVAQVVLAQGRTARLKPPTAVEAAAAVVADQVGAVVKAARAASNARTEDGARMMVQAAEAGALAAAVTARVADAYMRLEMVQAGEGAALAVTARLAASEQLRTAVNHTQAAIASAAAANKAAMEAQGQEVNGKILTHERLDTVRHAKAQTEFQVYLGIAWAQSASYWTQSAGAWDQDIDEVALASEAAAVAAESAATMVEGAVGVAIGAAVSQGAFDLNSMMLFATAASPSESAISEDAPVATAVPSPSSPSDAAPIFDDHLRPPPVDVASPSR